LVVTPASRSEASDQPDERSLSLRSLGFAAERQPGDRAVAPGELRLVQSFTNSRWDLDHQLQDRFSDSASLARWLVARELLDPSVQLGDSDLDLSLDVREGLRALMFVNNGAPPDWPAIERLNRALIVPGLAVVLDPYEPPDFRSRRRDLGAVVALLSTIVAAAQLDGRWSRMKACHGEHCGWVFYDHSRNQSGSWCAMSVCGSRAKARDYRRRRQ
jgi:predicted RNA-binding Zn ribbon-like protein